MHNKVAVLMGSDSDLPVAQKTVGLLQQFGLMVETRIISAHRTPQLAAEFACSARRNGFGVLIAVAGLAAHLAGTIAANTTLPVVGLPRSGGVADGLDALLATVQMPPGVPVATVGLDAGVNAGLLAVQILAVSDQGLAEKLDQYKQEMAEKVAKKDSELQRLSTI